MVSITHRALVPPTLVPPAFFKMPRAPGTLKDVPCKDWCFTTFEVDDASCLPSLEYCEYIIYQPEVCPDSNRPHVQGFLVLNDKKTLSALKLLLPGYHLEKRKGTRTQARDYCKKTDKGGSGDYHEHGVFVEVGDAGGAAQKKKFEEQLEIAKVGDFTQLSAEFQFKYLKASKEVFFLHLPKPVKLDKPCGVWIYGKSGCGKSTYVEALIPGDQLYLKTTKIWWDGYKGEDNVLIDEVDPINTNHMSAYYKKWTDMFIFPGEYKGGMSNFRPKKVYMTSQFTIEECFSNPKDADAIRRRCEVILHHPLCYHDQNITVCKQH